MSGGRGAIGTTTAIDTPGTRVAGSAVSTRATKTRAITTTDIVTGTTAGIVGTMITGGITTEGGTATAAADVLDVRDRAGGFAAAVAACVIWPLEAINGTPIVDIKAIAAVTSVPDASSARADEPDRFSVALRRALVQTSVLPAHSGGPDAGSRRRGS
jgi:hypothetical protein